MDKLLSSAHFEPHRRRLTNLARAWLGNQAEAEDAVQDAYLRVDSDAPESRSSMEAWLVTVLRNLCVDRLRRRSLEQREAAHVVETLHSPSAEHTARLSLDAGAALRQLVRRLRPDEVAVVLLYTVFDFEHADIALLTGQEDATSRQRLHRAMRRLREAERDNAAREGADREGADMLLGLCWRAMQTRSPAALMALLARPVTAASAGLGHASDETMPRSKATLLQSAGHCAMSIELDGVVLCAIPVGPLDVPASDEVLAS